MNRKVFFGTIMRPFTIAVIVLMTQALFLCVFIVGDSAAQQFSTSATATQISKIPGSPNSIEIKQNMLLQQQASINQSITVAKACIKNSSMTQVLRDPEGNIRIVPSTDVVNCTRTLNELLNLLASNQKALNNLSQDAQLQFSTIITQANKDKLRKRLQIITGGLPPSMN